RDEIGSLQVDLDRAPPAAAVGDGNGADLAKSARAIDQHIHRVGLGGDRGDEASYLSIVGDVADESLDPGKIAGDAGQTIGATGAEEDTMAFARQRLRQPRSDAGAAAGDDDPKRPAPIHGFALDRPAAFELGDPDFVGALAHGGTRYGPHPRRWP